MPGGVCQGGSGLARWAGSGSSSCSKPVDVFLFAITAPPHRRSSPGASGPVSPSSGEIANRSFCLLLIVS